MKAIYQIAGTSKQAHLSYMKRQGQLALGFLATPQRRNVSAFTDAERRAPRQSSVGFAPEDWQGQRQLALGFLATPQRRNVSVLADAARRAPRQSSGGFAPEDW